MPSEVVTWDMIAALGRVVIYMAGVAAIVGMLWALWRGWKNKRDSKRRWLGWVDYLHHSVERPSTPRYRASGECGRCEELQAESIRAAVQVGFDEGRRKGVARCHGPQPLLSDPWGMKAFRATCEQVRREEMDGYKTVTASEGYEFKITGLDGHPQTTREYREDACGNVSFDALPHAELARPDIEFVEIEPSKPEQGWETVTASKGWRFKITDASGGWHYTVEYREDNNSEYIKFVCAVCAKETSCRRPTIELVEIAGSKPEPEPVRCTQFHFSLQCEHLSLPHGFCTVVGACIYKSVKQKPEPITRTCGGNTYILGKLSEDGVFTFTPATECPCCGRVES